MPMTLTPSSWLIAVLFGLLALSPAHAGMTPQEVEWFKDAKAWAEKGEAEGQCNLGICYYTGEGVAKDFARIKVVYQNASQRPLLALTPCNACKEWPGRPKTVSGRSLLGSVT